MWDGACLVALLIFSGADSIYCCAPDLFLDRVVWRENTRGIF
jgi:hypothetical protein